MNLITSRNILIISGVVVLLATAVLSTMDLLLPEDKDLITGLILGIIGGGAVGVGTGRSK